jgi:two-component system phosphate regulon response regulator PhoB
VRNVVYRFEGLAAFAKALAASDQELPLPPGTRVDDNEWVLAIFELDAGRATASAARGLDRGGGNFALSFERRDWERLTTFAMAQSGEMPAALSREVPYEEGAPDSIPISVGPPISDPTPTPKSHKPPSTKAASTRRRSATTLRSLSSEPPSAAARVLLVDDDRDIREVVGAMLDAVGLKVETAQSAEEALERVRSRGYDLLVLDWNLPGMNGIELCRLIRKDPPLSWLPVLFLTAHASSQDIVEAFASGADDYVVKPFRAPELGARIFGLLRRTRVPPSSPS